MRRLVAALVVAMLALTLSACGGGGTDEQATTSQSEAAAPVASTPAGVQVPTDVSPVEPVEYVALVPEGVKAPAAVEQRLKGKQPFILVFYDEKQPVTDDQQKIIADVQAKYRGLADLVSYDIGKYASITASAGVEVDPALSKDQEAVQAALLAQALDVRFTPYVIVVDKNGYTTYRGRGLVDGSTLEREVLRVGE